MVYTADHEAFTALKKSLDGFSTHACGQYSIVAGWTAPSNNITRDSYSGIIACRISKFFLEFLGRHNAFSKNDEEMILVHLSCPVNIISEICKIKPRLRDHNRLCSAGKTHFESDKSGIPSH